MSEPRSEYGEVPPPTSSADLLRELYRENPADGQPATPQN